MKSQLLRGIFTGLLVISSCGSAFAGLISGDFKAQTTYVEPRLHHTRHSDIWQRLDAEISTGAELTNDDLIATDSYFRQHAQADIDISAEDNTLTIIPLVMGGIHEFEVWVDNITLGEGESISGISMVNSGMIPATPVLEYTNNSLHIFYSSANYFNFDLNVSDRFEISVVPEPGMMVLLGMGGFMGMRRRGK